MRIIGGPSAAQVLPMMRFTSRLLPLHIIGGRFSLGTSTQRRPANDAFGAVICYFCGSLAGVSYLGHIFIIVLVHFSHL